MQSLSQIDMFTPAQACKELGLSDEGLLDMVNAGRLAAYNLGGNIRFTMLDVFAVQRDLIAV